MKINLHEEHDTCQVCEGRGETGGFYIYGGDIDDDITTCTPCQGTGLGLGGLLIEGLVQAPALQWSPLDTDPVKTLKRVETRQPGRAA